MKRQKEETEAVENNAGTDCMLHKWHLTAKVTQELQMQNNNLTVILLWRERTRLEEVEDMWREQVWV